MPASSTPLTPAVLARGAGAAAVVDAEALATLAGAEPVVLQVEGLEPRILARAGGEDRGVLRAAVRALAGAGRQVVVRAPLADARTQPEELIEAVTEVARLTLWTDGAVSVEALPSPPPADPWVAAALAVPLVDPGGLHTASLARLRDAWVARTRALEDPDEVRRGEILCRLLDDGPRRTVFATLRAAWQESDDGWPGGPLHKPTALATAERVLGEHERWQKAFRQYTYDMVRRLVLVPTWQCELRCAYCFIPKQDGREMPLATIERGVEMLLSTEQPKVLLQFFGGEALLEYERVKHAITYAERRAAELGKEIGFILSSNGWSLDAERVAWLAEHDVELELSLDGDQRTQDRFRASRWRGASSYEHSIAQTADLILSAGLRQHVIMVVHPTNVDAMPANFFHVADLGFRHIQINNMLGRVWTPEQLQSFAKGLHAIGQELIARWARGEELEFINMRHRPMAMRLNGEVTVDHDGTIYGGNGFLHETEHKDTFVTGHLDDLTNVDRYWIDATANDFLLDWSYRPKVTANNVEVGKVMASFVRWMHKRGFAADGPTGHPVAGHDAA